MMLGMVERENDVVSKTGEIHARAEKQIMRQDAHETTLGTDLGIALDNGEDKDKHIQTVVKRSESTIVEIGEGKETVIGECLKAEGLQVEDLVFLHHHPHGDQEWKMSKTDGGDGEKGGATGAEPLSKNETIIGDVGQDQQHHLNLAQFRRDEGAMTPHTPPRNLLRRLLSPNITRRLVRTLIL